MNKPVIVTRLQEQAEENPAAVLGGAAALIVGLGKFVDSIASARSKNAYAKQVKQRQKK